MTSPLVRAEAVKAAVEADGGNVDDFEVVALSLNRAVELLASAEESPAFHFIPPTASMKYIQDYLSKSTESENPVLMKDIQINLIDDNPRHEGQGVHIEDPG